MNTKKILYVLIFLILLLIFLQGCFSSFRETVVHDPPLAQNVSRLVKGKTTRSEVLEWFCVPDLQADGADITLYPHSAMGEFRQKKRAEIEKQNKYILEYNKKKRYRKSRITSPLGDPDWWDKYAKLQAYSSIDEEHVALLYLESDSKVGVAWVPTGAGYGKYNYRLNKLLIFIHKETGIVDEFSYREEFKADQQ